MAAQFSELSTLAKKINSSTDQDNARIREANEALAKLDIGIEAWHPMHVRPPLRAMDGKPGETKKYNCKEFGFAKVEGKWQLAIRTVTVERTFRVKGKVEESVTNERDVRPLHKANRSERYVGAHLLERITDAIKNAMTEALEVAETPEA